MNYAKIYQDLISKAKSRIVDGYVEVHHIVPRCLGGSDKPDNLVRLTPEEHFVAHLLLVRIYPGNPKLVYAANMMTVVSGNHGRTRNKQVGWLRRQLSRDLSDMMNEPERRQLTSERMTKDNPMKKPGVAQRVAEIRRERGNLGRKAVSKEERSSISERMKANNPCSGLSPWHNNRATPEALEIWRQADSYYDWWVLHRKGYCAMATAFGFKDWMSAHQNLVNKFKAGWIPKEDPQWLTFVGLKPTAV